MRSDFSLNSATTLDATDIPTVKSIPPKEPRRAVIIVV